MRSQTLQWLTSWLSIQFIAYCFILLEVVGCSRGWKSNTPDSQEPLKELRVLCCQLKGKLLFIRGRWGEWNPYHLFVKEIPEGREEVAFSSPVGDPLRYQISPDGGQVAIEVGWPKAAWTSGHTFYRMDMATYRALRIPLPADSENLLWVDDHTVSTLRPGMEELHYDLETHQMKVIPGEEKFARFPYPTVCIPYLQRRFAPQLRFFERVCSRTNALTFLQSDEWCPSSSLSFPPYRWDHPDLYYLRTVGAWNQIPLVFFATDTGHYLREACASPDGKRVVFNALIRGRGGKGSSGFMALKLIDIETKRPQQLIELPGWISELRWLPDSRHLVFGFWDEREREEDSQGVSWVCVMDIQTGAFFAVTKGWNAFWLPI